MITVRYKNIVYPVIAFLCLVMLFSCSRGGGNQEQTGEAAVSSQQGEGAEPSAKELQKRIQELESENERLRVELGRDRFRADEMEKRIEEFKTLKSSNRELTRQNDKLNEQLAQALNEIKSLKERMAGKNSVGHKYKKGDCVEWYGGLYEGKKVMRGEVTTIKGDTYVVRCTKTGAPYLWAKGELYEFLESELRKCA
jgi:predicted RNase H-like nuclease (RuvC/YqgF family)